MPYKPTHRHDAERSASACAFLLAVVELARQHNVRLSHQDGQGAFIVEHRRNDETDDTTEVWLLAAIEEIR